MPTFLMSRFFLLLATAGAATIFLSTVFTTPEANLRLEPDGGVFSVDTTFTVAVVADASTPVNVFKGLLSFDPAHLAIERIDYNTGLIDLWAEEPWYSNGAGTLNFIGGTTKPGGFTGSDTLLTITFKTLTAGEVALTFSEARILKHNGLGSDALLNQPIDSLFVIETLPAPIEVVLDKSSATERITVLTELVSTDLNGDGRHTLADQSIFMTHLVSQNSQSDFNRDGRVTIADLSILLRSH